jgi:hypothetical protein
LFCELVALEAAAVEAAVVASPTASPIVDASHMKSPYEGVKRSLFLAKFGDDVYERKV